MTFVAIAILLAILLAALRVPIVLALLVGLLYGGSIGPHAKLLPVMLGKDLYPTLSAYHLAALVLFVLAGAMLERSGAVLGLPVPRDGDADHGGSTAVSGGTLGLPLPLAASLVLAATLTETSIAKAVEWALVPGAVLSAAYLAISGADRLAHRGPGAAPADVATVIVRCVAPPLCLLIFVLPVAAGLMTPSEAAAFVAVAALVLVFALVAISPRARAGARAGLAVGPHGVVHALLILASLTGLGILAGVAALPAAVAGRLATAGLPPLALLLVTVAVTLAVGTVVGPLAAIGLSILVFGGAIRGLGVAPAYYVTILFLTAEAARVGPRLWHGGFLRPTTNAGADPPARVAATWPYYLAAVAVLVVFAVVAR